MLNNIQDNNQFFENLHADTIYRIMNIYHDPYQKIAKYAFLRILTASIYEMTYEAL